MNSSNITIIILNWNGKDDTLSCLHSLLNTTYKNFNIIVVDNGSTDDSIDAISSSFPTTTILKTGENLGYAGGNNVGIRYALESNTDYILILNNDTIVENNCLDQLVAQAYKTNNKFIYGPAVFYENPSNTIWFAGAKWNKKKLTFDFCFQNSTAEHLPAEPYETDYICGAAMFFHRSIAEKTGLLDERFFLVWEESDWCLRARKAGYKSMVMPAAKIWHKIGVSFGSESSPLRQYYSFRNRLLWVEKNLTFFDWLKLLGLSLNPFFPSYSTNNNSSVPFFKKFVWSTLEWKKTWSSILLRAKRQAFFDYIFRNFGHCPQYILQLQREWQETQKSNR